MNLIDVLFVILYFIFPALWLKLLLRRGISLLHINIPSILIVSLVGFSYVGIMPLYFGLDISRSRIVTDEVILLKTLIISGLSITLACIGIVASNFKIKPFYLARSITSRLASVGPWVVCIFVTIIYLSKVDNIALFLVFQDTRLSELKLARSNMSSGFDNFRYYRVFVQVLPSFLFYKMLADKIMFPSNSNNYLITFAFIFVGFCHLITTSKGPFLWYLVGVFLVFVLAQGQAKVRINKKTLLFFLILLVCASVMYKFILQKDESIFMLLMSVFSRMFNGSVQSAYHYISYSDQFGHLYGRSFPNPLGIFPFEYFHLPREVAKWVYPRFEALGIISHMNSVYWAEMYVNFGYFGIVFFPVIVGIAAAEIQKAFYRTDFTPSVIALFVLLALQVKNLGVTSLPGYIFDPVFVFLIGCLYYLQRQRG